MNIQFLWALAIVAAVTTFAAGQDEYEDRYTPLIRRLKKERRHERRRHYYDSVLDQGESSSNDRQSSYNNNRQSSSNVDYSNPDAIRKIIADAQAQSSGGSSSSNYNTRDREPAFNSRDRQPSYNRESSYNTRDRETTRRPYYYDRAITRVPVQRIEQINRGVSTILGGVGGGSLDDILRGSFQFTRNENVRSVANNVLDAIFGRRGQ